MKSNNPSLRNREKIHDQLGKTTTSHSEKPYVLWFKEIGICNVPLVGGKNASLGEMYCELTDKGVKIPNGFAVTANAYRDFLVAGGLLEKIKTILKDLNPSEMNNLRLRGRQVRQAILTTPFPSSLEKAITDAYGQLIEENHGAMDVAVRSSATAEDLPDASFAGQQESYLNVEGHHALLDTCKRCYASLFTDRAISYRADKGFDHYTIALSICIQRMVRSDLASSGVMFSIDTETGFQNTVLINAAYGLGENIVQGTINPDEFYVFKPTLQTGFRPILQKMLGTKEFKLVYDVGGSRMVRNLPVSPPERAKFSINDEEILSLAKWACLIEKHYSEKLGRPTPMDIEWAKDGNTGELFILQARPETVQSQKDRNFLEIYHLKDKGKLLISGRSVGEKIGQGKVHVIQNAQFLSEFKEGEILVTDKTDPDWEPIMKKAAGIVTNRGGRTCHAAIVSRELGLPALVGSEHATDVLRNGQEVTLSCAEGDIGHVYDGNLSFEIERFELKDLRRPKTKVMMNIANPEEVLGLSFIPNDGVGLAREEFIISKYIKIHPMALVNYNELAESEVKTQIDALTAGYTDKCQYFVDKLAYGVGMIAAAFYPKDVILRLSDFKTNEYANLIGGRPFEPAEENPMLGFRGASRYYNPRYQAGFALECKAVRKLREEMGLTNLKIMIPFCRTVAEGERVIQEMGSHGLHQGKNGLEIYVMCEIPSNVILAESFADLFDGFSIGSNDLTQLILGVDRDSEIVAPLFDERNLAVKKMITSVIQIAKSKNCKIGICGQAPSDYPEFAQFLVEQGIDSISLNPDAVLKTTMAILEMEKEQRDDRSNPSIRD